MSPGASPKMGVLAACQPALLGSRSSHPAEVAWDEALERKGRFGDIMGILEAAVTLPLGFAHAAVPCKGKRCCTGGKGAPMGFLQQFEAFFFAI